MLLRRLIGLVVLAALGFVLALVVPAGPVAGSWGFFVAASTLLAIGLYGSTAAVPLSTLRQHRGLVIRVLTLGVVAKAALIALVMVLAFHDVRYVVLAVAMSQIDPLSVAVLQRSSRLSPRGRTILLAWSSFDDPVTATLVVVMVSVLAATGGVPTTAVDLLPAPLLGMLANAALIVVAWFAWRGLRRLRGGRSRGAGAPGWTVAACGVLVGLATAAVYWFLMLGLAATGLFFRPRPIERVLRWLTDGALVVATGLLGFLLASSVRTAPELIWHGAVLGVAAYGAQAAVAGLLTRSLPGDRLRLALGQQSGITAIVLALLLEPVVPGSVVVIAPAILVVNVLHLVANTAADHGPRLLAGTRRASNADQPLGDPPHRAGEITHSAQRAVNR